MKGWGLYMERKGGRGGGEGGNFEIPGRVIFSFYYFYFLA